MADILDDIKLQAIKACMPTFGDRLVNTALKTAEGAGVGYGIGGLAGSVLLGVGSVPVGIFGAIGGAASGLFIGVTGDFLNAKADATCVAEKLTHGLAPQIRNQNSQTSNERK